MKQRIPDEMAKRWATYTDGDTHNNAMPVENIVSMAQELIASRELLEQCFIWFSTFIDKDYTLSPTRKEDANALLSELDALKAGE